jgi:hypothetical protein
MPPLSSTWRFTSLSPCSNKICCSLLAAPNPHTPQKKDLFSPFSLPLPFTFQLSPFSPSPFTFLLQQKIIPTLENLFHADP